MFADEQSSGLISAMREDHGTMDAGARGDEFADR